MKIDERTSPVYSYIRCALWKKVEQLLPSDIVDQKSSSSTTVVRASDGAEGLLSSLQMMSARNHMKKREGVAHCVPNLKLDLLIFNGDHPRAKLHTNGQIMNGLEALVGELQQ
jgi:hypothetical protein